jgi:twitching motility protein PilT
MIMIERYLDLTINNRATDLHLVVGKPPTLRVTGKLVPVNTPPLSPEQTEAMMKEIIPSLNMRELGEQGATDFGYNFKTARFRVSVFRQQGNLSLALRLLPEVLYTFEELQLPPQLKTTITQKHGLFLITGPTGSGKTTTLATLVNYLSITTGTHIITIEDPVEYQHEHRKGIFTQREVGVDVPSFTDGLVQAMRQDPDVIMVGEIRSREATRTALVASETGHLVFGTMHANNASNTITRLVAQFKVDEQLFIRNQLANTLLGVISQQLMPTAKGNELVGIMEVMFCTAPITSLIRQEKEDRISDEILKGRHIGMQHRDEHLFSLCSMGKIGKKEALVVASKPQELEMRLRKI